MHASNRYTYFFVIIMAVSSALMLSLLKIGFQERVAFNRAIDTKKNILKAVGVLDSAMGATEIEAFYSSNFSERTVRDSSGTERIYYVYGLSEEPRGYVFPVSGKGVWSTINGFIALESDRNTIRGITFHDHGETPGLGGEIEKDFFTRQFIGKKIFREGELVSVTIAKGMSQQKDDYTVDGISGASLTTNGINRFLRKDLMNYLPLLRQ
ncbi:NADH:ubiquinone reductase (Na(+)-transporting) subunit C [Prosthecochloris sp. GSB1]|uniref:NADH:ubiquinone reductase (Na(+)-transporting) subunit C n=1 Tax=Prosthecochloris sp. GSB1 TaxID=281093 RepID=UPI000B8CD4ED|nr:NADH:ubiquinone reductase (Na(+)-transporting) subunit C [Prosthecochloris sp. GSB1]ASQ91404.1 NADH:ubiquinone reductase (Na(+)-transporting) subunit C [Prosthecochloris sp. GSB1]